MPFRVDLPGGESVRTDEMLHGRVVDLAKAHNTSWSVVIEAPIAGDGSLMADMYERLCAEHGHEVRTATMTTSELAAKFTPIPAAKGDEPDDGDEGDGSDPSTVDAPAKS